MRFETLIDAYKFARRIGRRPRAALRFAHGALEYQDEVKTPLTERDFTTLAECASDLPDRPDFIGRGVRP